MRLRERERRREKERGREGEVGRQSEREREMYICMCITNIYIYMYLYTYIYICIHTYTWVSMSVFAYESVEGRMSGDCRKGWVRVTRTLKASLIASNPWTGNVYDTSRLTSDTEVFEPCSRIFKHLSLLE